MDALAGFLDGPRARGAFHLRATMEPPWSIRVVDEAPLALIAVGAGEAWVTADRGEGTRLGPGDLVLARGPEPYEVSDGPDTRPQVVIHPGQHCRTPAGEDVSAPMALGVRTWGNRSEGSTVLLIGTYEDRSAVGDRLLRALPPLAVLRSGQLASPLVPLLGEEIARDDPGQEVVLDRLLDLLAIAALRSWFDRPEAAAPRWYEAHGDEVVGVALRMLHGDPARAWTVASLASEVGVSRALLARRFHELVGEPPMRYLTDWRLTLAADLLREPGTTLAAVAQQVGYGSPFALSAAFSRVRGISPQEHRRAALVG